MTVLHVVNSLGQGGTESFLVRLLQCLASRGGSAHSVVTLREAGELAADLPEEVGCEALRLQSSRIAAFRLARIARRRGVKLIHARNTCCWADGWLAAKLCGAAALLGFHGWDREGGFSRQWRRRIRWWLRHGASFSSVCRSGLEALRGCGVPMTRAHYLPNGVDIAAIRSELGQRSKMRASLLLSEGDVAVATVGALTAIKNHAALLKAFAEVHRSFSHARLLVIGDGPLRKELEALVDTMDCRRAVHFLGQRGDVIRVLAASDVYVSASLAEGMSNALLEAMSVGLPVLTTAAGDHGLIVRDGVEGVVTSPEVRALARGLSQIVGSAAVRRRLGESAARRVEEYGLEAAARRYQEVYEGLLRNMRCRCERKVNNGSEAGVVPGGSMPF